ncbi:MAG: LptA/OstA family protein [Planctomycetota bacterium]|nr:LptA/OstA family protein [Planctomycetota bacterium]
MTGGEAGAAGPGAGGPKIPEEELRREEVERSPTPEWLRPARRGDAGEGGRSGGGGGGGGEGGGERKDGPPELIDASAGDIEAQWDGAFERSLRRTRGRMPGEELREEVWKLEGNVRIEQPATGSLLRAQKVVLIRDADAGTTRSLQAEGAVEVVAGDHKARCERLGVEMGYDEKGTIVKNLYTIEGGGPDNRLATLWMHEDAIQARKITLDRVAMSFRAEGGFVAVSEPAVQEPAPAGREGGEGGASLAGIGIQPGKRIRIQADGPLVSEGREGRTYTSGNVLVRQEGFSLTCDRLELAHAPVPPGDDGAGGRRGGTDRPKETAAGPAPRKAGSPGDDARGDATAVPVSRKTAKADVVPGEAAGMEAEPRTGTPQNADVRKGGPAGARAAPRDAVPADPAASGGHKGLFAGDLRRIDASGRVVVVTAEAMVECDRIRYNMFKETIELDMDDPEKDVRIVLRDKGGKARLLLARGGLVYDRKQDRMTPRTGGAMRIVPYREPEKK